MEGDQIILFQCFVVLLLSRGTNEIKLTVKHSNQQILITFTATVLNWAWLLLTSSIASANSLVFKVSNNAVPYNFT